MYLAIQEPSGKGQYPMKKQINPTIKAHLIRGAFYLLLLVAVCAIPFALAQRNSTGRNFPNKYLPAFQRARLGEPCPVIVVHRCQLPGRYPVNGCEHKWNVRLLRRRF